MQAFRPLAVRVVRSPPPPPKDILVFSPSLHFFLLNLLLQSEQLVVYVSLFPSDRDVVSRAACYLDSLVLGLAVV